MLKGLPDESVQMCVTSPPYWGLRDYGADGQIGLEQTPEEYVSKLVAVFHEVKRVLRNDGTLWLNLGDSYASNSDRAGMKLGARPKGCECTYCTMPTKGLKATVPNGLKPKDLVGIPWRVAFALQADGWYLRQDIIWSKPNPMPESVTDRCTKAHEYIFLLAKSQRYYYDAEAVSEPANTHTGKVLDNRNSGTGIARGLNGQADRQGNFEPVFDGNRNRRSVWQVATMPYSGAHFATFPEELIEPCILAGSPEGGIVLDPFFGSGTTGAVSARLGRKWIGIELNPEYIKLAIDSVTPHDIQPQLLTACAAACEKLNEMKEAGE